ncbi:Uncharacterised protein [uncultured archaeon]|nr:Uncharacterised protein [uncultured archaeon]
MNIRYVNGRFEAEFSDFSGDMAAVKAAGWKCDGPPGWTWHSRTAAGVVRLREKHRPASGLTITPEAKAAFASLLKCEEQNAEVKKQLQKARKETEKKRISEDPANEIPIPEKGYIGKEDLSPSKVSYTPYAPPPKPATLCVYCGDPVYALFDRTEPYPYCLWCEKTVLDKCDGF